MSDESKGEHYKAGGIEVIDFMRAKSTPEELRGYLRLTAIKYLSRYGYKPGQNPATEIRKAQWFLNQLLKEIDNEKTD